MDESRISKLRTYLFNIIDKLSNNTKYEINADYLGDIGDYSLDKIPTETKIETFINGNERHADIFAFRCRKSYSRDEVNNLSNIGFFEDFEKTINSNNQKGILPDIENIESIECLNCFTLTDVSGTEGTFEAQIRIIYLVKE